MTPFTDSFDGVQRDGERSRWLPDALSTYRLRSELELPAWNELSAYDGTIDNENRTDGYRERFETASLNCWYSRLQPGSLALSACV